MRRDRVVRAVLLAGAAVAGSGLLLLVGVGVRIGHDVDDRCHEARSRYGGDCVEALVDLLEDGSRDYRSRNAAVWALGQLGDARALPALRSRYTGQVPARESPDTGLSQYELAKAVRGASGGPNVTRFFWDVDG